MINAAPGEVNVRRRTFIGQTIVTGVAAAIVGNGTVYAQATVAGCGQSSLADGLVIALSIVSQISSDAYAKLGSETTKQLTSCRYAFEELYSLLNQLSQELGKSGLKDQVTQLRNLSEVGQANWRLIKTAYGQEQNYAKPVLLTLAVVSKQITAQAQDLPDNTEWKLSKEASALLKRILVLSQSEDFKALHKDLTTTRVTTDERRTEISTQISTINQAILAARTAVILAENPDPRDEKGKPIKVNKAAQWRNADLSLESAIATIKDMIAQNRIDSFLGRAFIEALPASVLSPDQVKASLSQVTNDLTAADTLLMGLGTARREIRSPEHGFRASRDETVSFTKASYEPPPPPIDRQAMSKLLWTCCPPGSRDQIDKVDSVVAFVGGWNGWIPRAGREVLISSGLYWAVRFNRISCAGTTSLKTLAAGLAALV
jgi:hypothetical protein